MMSYLGGSDWMRGDEIVVVRGKKIPIGAKGKAFWYGPGHFRKYRVGVEIEGKSVFIDSGNVENVSRAERIAAEEKISAAKREAAAAAVKLAESRYGKPVYGKEDMGAYGGSHFVSMEIFDVSRSDDEIKADLNLLFPVWKGGAALRWGGSPVSEIKIDRDLKVVSFYDHYSMAD